MTILSVGDLAQSWNNNQVWRQHWHKTASPTVTGSGFWLDLSMAAGTPKYNPYVGNALEFTPLVGASNNGINCGLGGDAYILRYAIGGGGVGSGIWPGNAMLLDYVGFYPLVDMDSTDVQVMDNVNYASRYTSGMRLMVVTTIPQTTLAPTEVRMLYEGSNGVQAVARFWINAINVAGNINVFSSATGATSGFACPLVPLVFGTLDVQRVINIEVTNSSGGFCALVLVKPILEAPVYDTVTTYELDLPRNRIPPFVPNGAYLNHIVCAASTGTVTGISRGHIVFARD
jgi:hypothetical protein